LIREEHKPIDQIDEEINSHQIEQNDGE